MYDIIFWHSNLYDCKFIYYISLQSYKLLSYILCLFNVVLFVDWLALWVDVQYVIGALQKPLWRWRLSAVYEDAGRGVEREREREERRGARKGIPGQLVLISWDDGQAAGRLDYATARGTVNAAWKTKTIPRKCCFVLCGDSATVCYLCCGPLEHINTSKNGKCYEWSI